VRAIRSPFYAATWTVLTLPPSFTVVSQEETPIVRREPTVLRHGCQSINTRKVQGQEMPEGLGPRK
jgi:hypothetical protein